MTAPLCAALTAPGSLLREAVRPRSLGAFLGFNVAVALSAHQKHSTSIGARAPHKLGIAPMVSRAKFIYVK